jgi:hypothetical protein
VLHRDEVVIGLPERVGRQLLGVVAVAVVLGLDINKETTESMGHAVIISCLQLGLGIIKVVLGPRLEVFLGAICGLPDSALGVELGNRGEYVGNDSPGISGDRVSSSRPKQLWDCLASTGRRIRPRRSVTDGTLFT